MIHVNIFCLQGPSVCCLHEVLSDWSGMLTKNIAGSSGIELPILFASIESIDTFVSIDDIDTFSIVSPITNTHRRNQGRNISRIIRAITTGGRANEGRECNMPQVKEGSPISSEGAPNIVKN